MMKTVYFYLCASYFLPENETIQHTGKEGGVYMATSSITKSFIISGQKQVEMFADAIEASAKSRPVRVPVSAREITEEKELIEFMEKWEKSNIDIK